MIKVSVIVTVFNGAKYLPKLLTNLSQKATKEFQVVVVDDGSIDQSFVIASGFKEFFHNYTLKKLDTNMGVGTARNIGMELSIGEYLYFLDCDDWISGSFLSGVEFDPSAGSDLVLSPVRKQVSNSSNESYLSALASAEHGNRQDFLSISMSTESWPGECWGLFLRREFLEKHQIRFKSVLIAEDMAFMTEVSLKMTSYSISKSPVYIHIHFAGSLGKSFSNQNINSWFRAMLSVVNLAQKYPPTSLEGVFIIQRLAWSCAYFLVSLILSDIKSQHQFLEKVVIENVIPNHGKLALVDGIAVLGKLAQVEDRDFLKSESFLEKLTLNAGNAVKSISGLANSKNIYLYCYDRLSMGVCKLMLDQNISVSGIIDDNADLIVENKSLNVKLLSPDELSQELLQGSIIVVCHDKSSVFHTIDKRLRSKRIDDLKVVNFTTVDFVNGLPLLEWLGAD